MDNVVVDVLWRLFEGDGDENLEVMCSSPIQSLPLFYSSLKEHQKGEPRCSEILDRELDNPSNGGNFQIYRNLLFYNPRRAQKRRWVFPASLRPMLLHYFHDTPLSGHLVSRKTLSNIAANFWWPRIRAHLFKYVRRGELCQRAKPA